MLKLDPKTWIIIVLMAIIGVLGAAIWWEALATTATVLTVVAILPLVVLSVLHVGQSNGRAFAVGPLVFAIGLITITIVLVWKLGDVRWPIVPAAIYMLYGMAWTAKHAQAFLFYKWDRDDDAASIELFNRHLVLLGAALLIGGLTSCILLSGIVYHNHAFTTSQAITTGDSFNEMMQPATVDPTTYEADAGARGGAEGSSQEATKPRKRFGRELGLLLLLSGGNAVLGAMFFVANATRRKREVIEQRLNARLAFNRTSFWGGTWFRAGEAVIFTLVTFHVLWLWVEKEGEIVGYAALPLLALLLGMFVKAGEKLMLGIYTRLFSVVESVVGGTPAAASRAGLAPKAGPTSKPPKTKKKKKKAGK